MSTPDNSAASVENQLQRQRKKAGPVSVVRSTPENSAASVENQLLQRIGPVNVEPQILENSAVTVENQRHKYR